MVMKKEQFDTLLEELVNEGTTEGRKSMIAFDLIKANEEISNHVKDLSEVKTKLSEEKDLLQRTNVHLFRQQLSGYTEEPKEKPFSKQITLEGIEQRINQYKG